MMSYIENKKFLEKLFGLAHKDIEGELFDSNENIDLEKYGIVIKTINEVINDGVDIYALNFLKNFNIEGDYSNINLDSNLKISDFKLKGFDGRFIINQEFGIPYGEITGLPDSNYYCIESGYEIEGCYSVYTEEEAQVVLDDMFSDHIYDMEETIEQHGFDIVVNYLTISSTDKRLIVNDMIENDISNYEGDEIVERLSDFQVGEYLYLIEEYNELKEEIDEKEFEGENFDDLNDKLENILFTVEDKLRTELRKYYTNYLVNDFEDFLWEFGYIDKNSNGKFVLVNELPSFILFDKRNFIENENWYEPQHLSPYEEVYETYQLGKWFYIVKMEE